MQSETIYTTASGKRCQYEVIINHGQASANVVWLNGQPEAADIQEFETFITGEADRAQFPHSGAENILLGEITPDELPRAQEIIAERTEGLNDA